MNICKYCTQSATNDTHNNQCKKAWNNSRRQLLELSEAELLAWYRQHRPPPQDQMSIRAAPVTNTTLPTYYYIVPNKPSSDKPQVTTDPRFINEGLGAYPVNDFTTHALSSIAYLQHLTPQEAQSYYDQIEQQLDQWLITTQKDSSWRLIFLQDMKNRLQLILESS